MIQVEANWTSSYASYHFKPICAMKRHQKKMSVTEAHDSATGHKSELSRLQPVDATKFCGSVHAERNPTA